ESLGDEPTTQQGAHHGVDVDGTDGGDRTSAYRLLVRGHRQRFERRLREPGGTLGEYEVSDRGVVFGPHVDAPSSAHLTKLEPATHGSAPAVEVCDECRHGTRNGLHGRCRGCREADDALRLVADHQNGLQPSLQLLVTQRLGTQRFITL